MRWKAADMIQPDVSWAGGFTECLRIAREAAELGIPTWLHQAGTPWGLHLTACLPMPCMAETFGPSRNGVENELYRRLRPSPREGFSRSVMRQGLVLRLMRHCWRRIQLIGCRVMCKK
ncbi:MAG: hypothetical protein OXU23_22080 [Candidatus Poribacteria bacterium]|nr:hypothetical protein [Candidatus Poribacteria bacterium]